MRHKGGRIEFQYIFGLDLNPTKEIGISQGHKTFMHQALQLSFSEPKNHGCGQKRTL